MKDFCKIMPLGAGREIGRSCFYVEYSRLNVKGAFLLDCGINPSISESNAKSDVPALPFFDLLLDEGRTPIDFILISHFHTDHVGGLPAYLLARQGAGLPEIPVYMTQETYEYSLAHFNELQAGDQMFRQISSKDQQSTSRVAASRSIQLFKSCYRQISFNSTIKLIKNVGITAYHAGHVVGAAMFLVNLNNFQLLYTGDYSMEVDYTLRKAEIPQNQKIDVLITEGTYGTRRHTERKKREEELVRRCVETLQQKGKVLVPVFATGRVYEVLNILDQHWKRHPELQKYKIRFISTGKRQAGISYSHVDLDRDAAVDTNYEQIIFCTPGMLQSGVSRDLFEKFCDSDKNLLLVVGYASKGTPLHELLQEKDRVKRTVQLKSRSGALLKINIKVAEISFSAHSDYDQTCDLLKLTIPENVVFIHGSRGALTNLVADLKQRIMKEESFEILRKMTIFCPENGEEVIIPIEKPVLTHLNIQKSYDQFIAEHSTGLMNNKQYKKSDNNNDEHVQSAIYLKQDGLNVEVIDRPAQRTKYIIQQGIDFKVQWGYIKEILLGLFGKNACNFDLNVQTCKVDITLFMLICDNTNPFLFNQFIKASIDENKEVLDQIKQQYSFDDMIVNGYDNYNKSLYQTRESDKNKTSIINSSNYLQIITNVQQQALGKIIFLRIQNQCSAQPFSQPQLNKDKLSSFFNGKEFEDCIDVDGIKLKYDERFTWYVDDQLESEKSKQLAAKLQKILQVWL